MRNPQITTTENPYINYQPQFRLSISNFGADVDCGLVCSGGLDILDRVVFTQYTIDDVMVDYVARSVCLMIV